MERDLYATISINKENERKEAKIYRTKGQCYGVEIDTEEKGKMDIKKADNITISKDKINGVLETIVSSIENFEFIEYIAQDHGDIKGNMS